MTIHKLTNPLLSFLRTMASSCKTLQVNILSAIFYALFLASVVNSQLTKPGCRDRCGNVTIPYPFGIGKRCALNANFSIICNETIKDGPKAFLPRSRGALEIINISLDGYIRKYTYVAQDCYSQTGVRNHNNSFSFSRLPEFFYSTRNKFTAVGCDTGAILNGFTGQGHYFSGCISRCYNESIVINGSCSGLGCCQVSIPKQLYGFEVNLSSFDNHTDIGYFNPCSYAFIADEEYFNFSTQSLKQVPHVVPTVLDWAIGNQSCKEAVKDKTSYACKSHSHCLDSDNGPGYRCACSDGFKGNPYIDAGCKDVNECQDPKLNGCTYSHKCHNINGSYTCSCPKWSIGDGRRAGTGCSLDQKKIIHAMIGTGTLLIILAAGSYLLYIYRRKQMRLKCKANFFKQNGGAILLDKKHRGESSISTIEIFKIEELEVATDNFRESRICGEGGYGTVYKGYLSDGTVVAIKKSKAVDPRQTEQFINEILVLSQIKHQNVVRFLGCCFETPEPLLVYEFISNGTLSDHIHKISVPRLSWRARLNIAAETAGVLAYLHSAHSPPIIHRDIKPTNILLDGNFSAKVSDFGSSKLIPKNENEMCTMVQGTLGYLDPEYLQTGQLTEKSDVYSFGVVLIELLTGLKAVSFERHGQDWSLVNYFLAFKTKDTILEILDKGLTNEDNMKDIMEVANIAKACVAVKGEERPRMKEISRELEGLLMTSKHKWAKENLDMEETECLFSKVPDNHSEISIQTAGYSGTQQGILALNINDGR